MIIQTILNGKLQDTAIPTSWDQVPYSQFLELLDCGEDYCKILSVFTGVPAEAIRVAKIKNLDTVIHLLGFLNEPVKARLPERLNNYAIPKDLGFSTMAQFEDLRKEIKESMKLTPNEQLTKYPLYCAVYTCNEMNIMRTKYLADKFNDTSIKYGEYHWRKAEDMQKEFLYSPAPEVLGIGNFTLLKLTGLNLRTNPSFRPRISRLKRLKLALKRWLLRLESMAHSFTWQGKQEEQRMKLKAGQSINTSTE